MAVVASSRLGRLTLASALLMTLAAAGCASRGATPRPFPGAPDPPATRSRPSPTVTPETLPIASELVATALALKGMQYRNGGSEPSRGFDCSGLVQWVFAQHGTALPRETREQYRDRREGGRRRGARRRSRLLRNGEQRTVARRHRAWRRRLRACPKLARCRACRELQEQLLGRQMARSPADHEHAGWILVSRQ